MIGSSTKNDILTAALQLLGDHGFEALTGPRVAKKARVRQSHLTYYFPKRTDLLAAVAQRYIETVAEEAISLSARGESTDALVTAVLGDRRRVRTLIALFVASEEDEALRGQLVQSVLATRALMADALGVKEGDPRATLLQATLWGLGLQHLLIEAQSEKELQQLVALAGRAAGTANRKRRSAA
jgi:AcrR family transcriptional regulator